MRSRSIPNCLDYQPAEKLGFAYVGLRILSGDCSGWCGKPWAALPGSCCLWDVIVGALDPAFKHDEIQLVVDGRTKDKL